MGSDLDRRARVTALCGTGDPGDPRTVNRLVPLIYDELREMAHRQLRREGSEHTLQTTALVHEAYLRLAGTDVVGRGRAYFFAAAARAMREVLVDRARRRRAAKRGGGAEVVTLRDRHGSSTDAYAFEVLALDEALRALSHHSPRQARVVECRFFAGMSVPETAEILEVSTRTVESDWAMARAWLFDALQGKRAVEGGRA
jgi:RNA polymerase sigma factor (TIGR02999 family)